MVGALRTIGAWEYMAESEEDVKVTAGKPSKASSSPKGFRHYVSIMHTLVDRKAQVPPPTAATGKDTIVKTSVAASE